MELKILLTETVKYYGKEISVESLGHGSDKKVQIQCPVCNQIRLVSWKGYCSSNNTICHKCGLGQRKKDLIKGSKYNRWIVLGAGKQVGFSKCECECGTIKDITNTSLKQGSSKSCGCLNIEQLQSRRQYLIINKRYGRLVVKGHSEKAGYSFCECDCGAICEISNMRLKTGIVKSCGCLKGENLKNHRILKGKDHPNWQGGISKERERTMQTKVYKTWRTSIYERDNYTCQKCGQVGYQLNVHHIQSYAEHENKRCDKDNGVTFCRKCHLKFHKKYGRKNINKNQLNEFLGNRNKEN